MKELAPRKTTLVLGLVAVIACGVVLTCRSITVSLEAERTLHAYTLTLDVLEQYMSTNAGNWPRSWEDLARVTPEIQSPVFRWPDDLRRIRQRISIDFNLTREQVAATDPTEFSGVVQVGPNYGPDEARIRNLIMIAKKNAGQKEKREEKGKRQGDIKKEKGTFKISIRERDIHTSRAWDHPRP